MTTNTDAVPLKPCPFCGGPVEIERCTDTYERLHGHRQWWGIVCRNGGNRGGTCAVSIRPQASIEVAAARWNLRAPASEVQADHIVDERKMVAVGEVYNKYGDPDAFAEKGFTPYESLFTFPAGTKVYVIAASSTGNQEVGRG